PVTLRLRHPILPLELAGLARQVLRVPHAVVVRTRGDAPRPAREHDDRGAGHGVPRSPAGADAARLRSNSWRYFVIPSATAEAILCSPRLEARIASFSRLATRC